MFEFCRGCDSRLFHFEAYIEGPPWGPRMSLIKTLTQPFWAHPQADPRRRERAAFAAASLRQGARASGLPSRLPARGRPPLPRGRPRSPQRGAGLSRCQCVGRLRLRLRQALGRELLLRHPGLPLHGDDPQRQRPGHGGMPELCHERRGRDEEGRPGQLEQVRAAPGHGSVPGRLPVSLETRATDPHHLLRAADGGRVFHDFERVGIGQPPDVASHAHRLRGRRDLRTG